MAVDLRPETWTVSSNEALNLSLVDENGAVNFKPTFTYPIYGDSEQIFGYKNLQIFLAFDSITFKPFINVKYDSKLNNEIEDVQKLLLDKLPEDDVIIRDEEAWIKTFTKEQETFTLPEKDKLVEEYEIGDQEFVIYRVSLQDPTIKMLHKRMQIFTLLFIESASYIDENDSSWEIFIVFNKSSKQCIGYTTTYQFWKYLGAQSFDSSKADEQQCRAKISQFLIMPPYQGHGHGKRLYQAIVKQWMNDLSVVEITVEDPNESFDDLRDRCDFERVINKNSLADCPNELPINIDWITKKQAQLKLEKRQFMRILEMFLLYQKSPNYRLQLKKRIYEKNFEALMDMDESLKKDKLQTAFQSLTEDYNRILSKVTIRKRTLSDSQGVSDKRLKA
ncbi:Hat1 [Kluyveromyces lactis]|nr:Hat1 [Kluyveromyces lactis]